MKKEVINYLYNLILKYNQYNKEEKEKLLYGLEGLYLTITKLIVIVILALLLHIIKEVFFTILFFNIIRYTGFGFHAEKSYQCLITSTIFFVLLPLLFKYIDLNFTVSTIIIGIGFYIGYLFASPSIGKCFILALVIESIIINPLFYKLFKQPYANYKKIK